MKFDSWLLNLSDRFISFMTLQFRINKIVTLGIATILCVILKVISIWQANQLLDFMDFFIIGGFFLGQIFEQYLYNKYTTEIYNILMNEFRIKYFLLRILILAIYAPDIIGYTYFKFLPYNIIFDVILITNMYLSYAYTVPMPPKRKREPEKS